MNGVPQWQASIFWRAGEDEIICGPLGAIMYYLRRHRDRISRIEMTPIEIGGTQPG